jgi:hypothetical protein
MASASGILRQMLLDLNERGAAQDGLSPGWCKNEHSTDGLEVSLACCVFCKFAEMAQDSIPLLE